MTTEESTKEEFNVSLKGWGLQKQASSLSLSLLSKKERTCLIKQLIYILVIARAYGHYAKKKKLLKRTR